MVNSWSDRDSMRELAFANLDSRESDRHVRNYITRLEMLLDATQEMERSLRADLKRAAGLDDSLRECGALRVATIWANTLVPPFLENEKRGPFLQSCIDGIMNEYRLAVRT